MHICAFKIMRHCTRMRETCECVRAPSGRVCMFTRPSLRTCMDGCISNGRSSNIDSCSGACERVCSCVCVLTKRSATTEATVSRPVTPFVRHNEWAPWLPQVTTVQPVIRSRPQNSTTPEAKMLRRHFSVTKRKFVVTGCRNWSEAR